MVQSMDSTIAAIKRSAFIDQQLLKDKQQYERFKQVPKLLILGTGDSGKTTFLKQLSILDGKKYSSDEIARFKSAIIEQIVDSLKIIGGICQEKNWVLSNSDIELIGFLAPGNICDSVESIGKLVANTHVQQAFIVGHQYNMLNQQRKTIYILRVRISTKEISETRYDISGGLIVYDVGGQRGLRKQWMPFFDMVHSIVFVTDISSYDQTLVENPTVNRLKDAIELFGKISNSPIMLHVNIVLLLNKMDLFERKLCHIPVQHYFPSYQDSPEPTKVVKFFEKQFLKQCKRTRNDGNIIVHPTKCTDTKSMQVILLNVVNGLLKSNLKNLGYA
ncbi:guanine nucleotide-binding protein subunit alpha [Terramyces sp. JEL0728]|nr:guanine nucleotide-binding protein subunit alpha [Terramyces sp. JEL0728]